MFAQLGGAVEIHQLHLCRKVSPLLTNNEYPRYDTKQSDGEAPVILELLGIQNIPSLPLLPGPFWPEVVAPDRILSVGQTDLSCVLMLN